LRDAAADVVQTHGTVAAVAWHGPRAIERRTRSAVAWARGWPGRRDPDREARRYLDAPWYAEQHPEAGSPSGDPWQHYVAVGVAAGFAPNPVFHVAGYRYDNPDVDAHGGDPLRHWVLTGRARGASPHPLFDVAWYRAQHPDMGRMDPYLHYLLHGRAERRATCAAVEEGVDLAETVMRLPDPVEEIVSIIVPAYGRFALTYRGLHALALRTPGRLGARVHLVDDDPRHPLTPLLGEVAGLRIIVNPENLGFLRSCNRAVANVPGTFVVLLNNDAVVQDGWLDALLKTAGEHPETAMVGGRLLGGDGRLQEAGVTMYRDGLGSPYGRGDDPERPQFRFAREVDCVSGACLLIRRGAWEAVGGFDEQFAPAYFEEYDLAFALRAAGWSVRYQPDSRIVHAGSASYGIAARDRQTARNREHFRLKWADELARQEPGPHAEFLARERPHPLGSVLVIDDRVPERDRHAGGLWIAQWLELLRDAGMKVIFAPDDGRERQPYADQLRQAGIEVLAPGIDLDAWLDDNGRFLDRVVLARPLVADRRLPAVRRWTSARVLYFTHDLHWLREERRYVITGDPRAAVDSRYLREIESRIFRQVDGILTPSTDEVPLIRAVSPHVPIWVLTPFADAETILVSGDAPALAQRRAIMFIGGFAHLPNVDAALRLVRDVMPAVWRHVPDAQVLIVGDDPPPEVRALATDRVQVTGHLPSLEAVFGRVRMTVSPMRFGSGVKGKIITSLGAGVPVVTTSIGNEGLDLKDGVEALLGETAEQLAAQVVRLFQEPGLADSLAAAGRRFLQDRFSVERTRDTLLEALDLKSADGPRA